MLEIRKIGEDFYLVNGEYIASNFNEAVVVAYENKEKIKNEKKFNISSFLLNEI